MTLPLILTYWVSVLGFILVADLAKKCVTLIIASFHNQKKTENINLFLYYYLFSYNLFNNKSTSRDKGLVSISTSIQLVIIIVF